LSNRAERRRNMKTSELREQAIEALGQEPYVDLEADNDPTVVVRIWHPLLIDDAAQVRLGRYNNNEDVDKDENGEIKYPIRINGDLAEPPNIRFARAILGETEHERFVGAGGNSNDVQLAWSELQRVHEEDENVLSDGAEAEDPK
jgi:hypothetical protein